MIKGVNRQVVEITKPNSEYFEKVVFYVKPEFSSTSHGTLRERASIMAGSAGTPPKTKIKRKRFLSFISASFWLSMGAVIYAIASNIFN